jgi:hypothetical protein
MIRWVVALVVVLLMPSTAAPQTIQGVVVEDEARTPIGGVDVELVTIDGVTAATATTTDEGDFVVRAPRAGRYTLRLTHIAYHALNTDTLVLRSGEGVSVEVRMAATVIPVEPLTVTARSNANTAGFHERRRRGGLGRYVTREEIERHPGARTSDLLRHLPGIQLVPSAGSHLLLMRGGAGRCLPTIYIDGMAVRQFPGSGIDELVHPEMLEGVEVYTGASAPPPIHSRTTCGVVAFWTRPGEGTGGWSWSKLGIGAGAFIALILLTRAL